MELAEKATMADGDALANQEKYEQSFGGRLQKLETQLNTFWITLLDSEATNTVLNFFSLLTESLLKMTDTFGAGTTAIIGFTTAIIGVGRVKDVITSLLNSPKKFFDSLVKNIGKVFALYGCESIAA